MVQWSWFDVEEDFLLRNEPRKTKKLEFSMIHTIMVYNNKQIIR